MWWKICFMKDRCGDIQTMYIKPVDTSQRTGSPNIRKISEWMLLGNNRYVLWELYKIINTEVEKNTEILIVSAGGVCSYHEASNG
jgi:hypothetical protein